MITDPATLLRLNDEDPPFDERFDTAMANPRLATNLTNFQQAWRQSRSEIMAEVDFETLRGRMKAAKTEAIDNLDEYLASFVANAKMPGRRSTSQRRRTRRPRSFGTSHVSTM